MMFVHHMLTMLLIILSWYLYYVRIGTLILLVHDASDIWMLVSKTFILLASEYKTGYVKQGLTPVCGA